MKIIQPVRHQRKPQSQNQSQSDTSSNDLEIPNHGGSTSAQQKKTDTDIEHTRNVKGKTSQTTELESLSLRLHQSSPEPTNNTFKQLMDKGLRLLAMREHSSLEMWNKLNTSADDADAINAVIDELTKKKYLSNERFAESFVRSRFNKGHGPIKIKTELKHKGINETLITEQLGQYSERWFDHAQNQYKKKYNNKPIPDYKEWSKRARFLQSRGFTSEHIGAAIEPFTSNNEYST